MNGFAAALSAETKKAVRSAVMPVTITLAFIIPAMLVFMIFVMKNPELSHKLGLIGTKAKIMGVADWPAYLNFLSQAVCALSIVLFGFIGGWAFGREYMDRTVKDLLALPTPRYVTVLAKTTVVSAWSLVIFGVIFVVSLAGGFAVGLPLWDPAETFRAFARMLTAAVAVIYLNTVVYFIACSTRGYLAAAGFIIFSAALINFTGIIGYGEYYPWAVPVLYAVKSGGVQPGIVSWVIVALTGAAGLAGTMAWWRYADQG